MKLILSSKVLSIKLTIVFLKLNYWKDIQSIFVFDVKLKYAYGEQPYRNVVDKCFQIKNRLRYSFVFLFSFLLEKVQIERVVYHLIFDFE